MAVNGGCAGPGEAWLEPGDPDVPTSSRCVPVFCREPQVLELNGRFSRGVERDTVIAISQVPRDPERCTVVMPCGAHRCPSIEMVEGQTKHGHPHGHPDASAPRWAHQPRARVNGSQGEEVLGLKRLDSYDRSVQLDEKVQTP